MKSRQTYLISIVLHLVLLGCIFLLPPVRQTLFKQKPAAPKTTVSPKQVERVQKLLKEKAEERLAKKLRELERIESQLEKIEEERKQAYEANTEPLRANALEEARAAMESSLEEQRSVLQAMEKIGPELEQRLASLQKEIKALPPPPSLPK